MARNRKLYGLAKPARAPHTKTPQPFAATRRHQYWSVDIRHLDMANTGMKVYCVSILENYSRAILASGIFPAQDLSAYLMILYAATRQHRVPETQVSDSGAVFVTAKQASRRKRFTPRSASRSARSSTRPSPNTIPLTS